MRVDVRRAAAALSGLRGRRSEHRSQRSERNDPGAEASADSVGLSMSGEAALVQAYGLSPLQSELPGSRSVDPLLRGAARSARRHEDRRRRARRDHRSGISGLTYSSTRIMFDQPAGDGEGLGSKSSRGLHRTTEGEVYDKPEQRRSCRRIGYHGRFRFRMNRPVAREPAAARSSVT